MVAWAMLRPPDKLLINRGMVMLKVHDWFYEATAAGLVMQAEILLSSRDIKAIEHYLPKMERSCNFIERTAIQKIICSLSALPAIFWHQVTEE